MPGLAGPDRCDRSPRPRAERCPFPKGGQGCSQVLVMGKSLSRAHPKPEPLPLSPGPRAQVEVLSLTHAPAWGPQVSKESPPTLEGFRPSLGLSSSMRTTGLVLPS